MFKRIVCLGLMIVATSAVYLARRSYRALRGQAATSCGGCQRCDSTESTTATPKAFVDISELTAIDHVRDHQLDRSR